MNYNFTTDHQLNHRTIRFFDGRPVEENLIRTFLDIMNRTATSTGLQTYSVVRVTDPVLKKKVSQIASQSYIADAPELFIFLVDTYRFKLIAEAKGASGDNYRKMDIFFQGLADAYLAAQNLTNAVESYGLGANFLGSVLNDPPALIRLLDLPELTFPILGVSFGYPNDNPQLKPRMDLDLKIGVNSYPYSENILQDLKDYDARMTHYYDTREKNRRSDTYTDQVVSKMSTNNEQRSRILRYIQDQGFDLNLRD